MSKEAQVEQLTDYMAKFIAHVAKKLPDDVSLSIRHLHFVYRFLFSCHNKKASYDFYFIIEDLINL